MLTRLLLLDAEATQIGDTIDAILNNTKFNGVEVVDSAASKSVAINYSGDASSVTGQQLVQIQHSSYGRYH